MDMSYQCHKHIEDGKNYVMLHYCTLSSHSSRGGTNLHHLFGIFFFIGDGGSRFEGKSFFEVSSLL